MKIIHCVIALSFVFLSTTLVAAEYLTGSNSRRPAVSSNVMAAPGSTQYVIIMNGLSSPGINFTKSDVMVKLYDGTGNNPPCWVIDKIIYHNDPNVSGAGGKNACGRPGMSAGIVKIDVIPLNAPAGKLYNNLIGISIDAKRFYTGIIIEQEIAPIFNPNGMLKTPGTIKISKITEIPDALHSNG